MYIFFENKTKSIEVYNSVEYIMRQNYINIHVQLQYWHIQEQLLENDVTASRKFYYHTFHLS